MKLDRKDAAAAFAGLVALLLQVLLFRTATGAVSFTELGTGLFYGTWLLGVAVGALVTPIQRRWLALALVVPLMAWGMAVLTWGRAVLGIPAWHHAGLGAMALIFLVGVTPPGLAVGALLPSIGDDVRLLAFEAMGALVAGLVYSFGGAYLPSTVLAIVVAGAVGAMVLLLRPSPPYVPALSLLFVLAMVPLHSSDHVPTPDGVYQIVPKGTKYLLLYDGELVATVPPDEDVRYDMLALAAGDGPAAVIGDVESFLALRRRGIPCFLLVSEAAPYHRLLDALHLEHRGIVEGDPAHLVPAGTRLVILPDPFVTTLGEHRYVEVHYLRTIAGRIPDGVALMPVPVPGDNPPPPFLRMVGRAAANLREAFGHVRPLKLDGYWLVAGSRERVDSLLASIRASSDLASYLEDAAPLWQASLPYQEPSTTERPLLVYDSLQARLPATVALLYLRAPLWGWGGIVAILLVLLLLAGAARRVFPRAPVLQSWFVALVGFASMGTIIAVLMSLQSGTGRIVRDLAVVTATFMAGYVGGVMVCRGRWARALWIPFLLVLWLWPHIPSTLAGAIPVAFVGGMLTGAVASWTGGQLGARALRIILLWDHLGAAAGGLIAGAFFVVAFGSRAFFLATAVVFAISFLLERIPHPVLPRRAWTVSHPRMLFFLFLVTALAWMAAFLVAKPSPLEKVALAGEKMEPFPHWESNVAGRRVYRLETWRIDELSSIRGYGGPVGLTLLFGEDGTLLDIKWGPNSETPSWIRRVTPWLQKFRNLPPDADPMAVDAVSGATMTCDAVRRIVSRARALVMERLLHRKARAGEAGAAPLERIHLVTLLIALILMAMGLTFEPRLRVVQMVVAFLVMGWTVEGVVSLVDLALWSVGIPSGGPGKGLLVMLIAVVALLFGPLWCGHACPLGAYQELVWYARQWYEGRRGATLVLSLEPRPSDGAPLRGLGMVRYGLAGLSLLFFFLTGSQSFLSWDPLAYAFNPSAWSLTTKAILAMITVASWFFYRPHCRFTCPVGALLGLVGTHPALERLLPARRLAACDHLVPSPHSPACLRCNRCDVRFQKKM